MSSLWTPGGERPVEREPSSPKAAPTGPAPSAAAAGSAAGEREPTEEELASQLDELRQQLANTPAEVVIANHGFGLFELAALHLSLSPPQLDQARLAIDALSALVEGLAGRLGEPEPQLHEALSQLRLAYVQIKGSAGSETESD